MSAYVYVVVGNDDEREWIEAVYSNVEAADDHQAIRLKNGNEDALWSVNKLPVEDEVNERWGK